MCIWNNPFDNFIVAIMSWLTVIEYQFHTWQWICSNCRNHGNHNPVLFSSNHQMCTYMSNMNGETCSERSTTYWTPEFTPKICVFFCCSIFCFLYNEICKLFCFFLLIFCHVIVRWCWRTSLTHPFAIFRLSYFLMNGKTNILIKHTVYYIFQLLRIRTMNKSCR